MADSAHDEAITDDELLFRRVSEKSGWYEPQSQRPISWLAFRPNSNDTRGISVWRAHAVSAEGAAAHAAKPNSRYYVLALRAGPLRVAGIAITSSPEEGGPGHASLANLTYDGYQRDKDRIRELAEKIVTDLVEDILGPFGPFGEHGGGGGALAAPG